ncbi:MAG TPA: hypothetical protein PKD09_16635 [Aggregatilinea sp.]|uniref:hypothetical protein n=1 Tax=Aggregatilinea sp. TaxID=2806333 RepID=UPI002BB3D5F2|nr:hypothetical protein [Aggregatilinea sp.]HML23283.1 hypothetical protein [Aggregatilinea sp.]
MSETGPNNPVRYTRFGGIFGVHGLRALTRRTYRSSMVWWLVRVVDGLIVGGGLVLIGVIIVVVNNMLNGAACFGQGAVGAILLGIFVLLWFMAAPFSQRWVVGVPDGWYYLVEDGAGEVVEFLGPGRWIVPWSWRAVVRPYANFQVIESRPVIEDALQSDFLPVTIEATVTVVFDPTQADPGAYDDLGAMATRDAFQQLLARQTDEAVRGYLALLTPTQGRSLSSQATLEDVIRQHVARLDILGLFVPASQPPAVTIRLVPALREAFFEVWENLGYSRYEMPTRLDLSAIERALDLPPHEAYQLIYLMQRGTRASRTTSQVARWQENAPKAAQNAPAPSPADWAAQTMSHDVIRDTLEHAVVPPADENPPIESPVPAEEPEEEVRQIRRGPNQAPDPFDLRRERKAKRRASKRLD